jgi:hypothetical protein
MPLNHLFHLGETITPFALKGRIIWKNPGLYVLFLSIILAVFSQPASDADDAKEDKKNMTISETEKGCTDLV